MTIIPSMLHVLPPPALEQLSRKIGLETSLRMVRQIDHEVRTASTALAAIPNIGSGPMGLTPDHVKSSFEYQQAKQAIDGAKSLQRRWNTAIRQAHGKAVDRAIRAQIDAARHARLEQPSTL